MATLDKRQGLALGSLQVHLLGWLCTKLLLLQTHISPVPSELMFISEEFLRPLSPGSVFPLLFYAWTPKPDRSQMCNGPSLHHCILELMRRPCCLILWKILSVGLRLGGIFHFYFYFMILDTESLPLPMLDIVYWFLLSFCSTLGRLFRRSKITVTIIIRNLPH